MIGERLKELRKEKGLTQEDLANIIGVEKSAVSLYERDINDPSDAVKVKIAKYFYISLDYLLGVIDQPAPYYRQDTFTELLGDMSIEERALLSEVFDYIRFRRERRAISNV